MAGLPLITGATGFAGSHLLDAIPTGRRSRARLVQPERSPAGSPPIHGVQWSPVDLLDRAAVRVGADGRVAVGDLSLRRRRRRARLVESPAHALRINVARHASPARRGARSSGLACPILVTGSALVYRLSLDPLTEDDPIDPTSPYGISKLAQEMLGGALAAPIPPRQAVQPCRTATGRALRDVGLRAAAGRDRSRTRASPSLRVGNLESRRDITDVRDTVRAYRALVAARHAAAPYNVCSGRALPDRRSARHPAGAGAGSRRGSRPIPARLRPSDNPVIVGDPTRIAAETGWRARFPSSRRWPISSITGDPPSTAPIHGQHEPGPAALGDRPADRPHGDGRLRPAAPLADVVAGDRAGRRRARVQPLRAAVAWPASSIAPGDRPRRLHGIVCLSRSRSCCCSILLSASARHRRRGVGHSGDRRRPGDARRARDRRPRDGRGTATRPSPASLAFIARRAPRPACSWPGGAGRRSPAAGAWPSRSAAPFAAALAAALVETIPIRLDDNLSVAVAAGAVLWLGSLVDVAPTVVGATLPQARARRGRAGVNALVASAGHRARTVSLSGAIVGAHHRHRSIYASLGWQGWALLLLTFIAASVASRLGLRRKMLLGIAEERGGRRGAGNAIANTGVAAIAAVLALAAPSADAARLAFVAALAAGGSDTIASEIGKAWGRRRGRSPRCARCRPERRARCRSKAPSPAWSARSRSARSRVALGSDRRARARARSSSAPRPARCSRAGSARRSKRPGS